MRIGFVGNTNNYPFMLARAMRNLGHDVQFIVSSTAPLYRPEHRYPDVGQPYPEWIHDLSPIRLRDVMYFGSSARRRILEILGGCDAVIANDFGPIVLPELRMPSIAMLTGSDLYAYADTDTFMARAGWDRRIPEPIRSIARTILSKRLVQPQRAGIQAATAVAYFPRGILSHSDRILDELGVRGERRILSTMTDANTNELHPPPLNSVMRVFCGARLTWASLMPKGAVEIDYKGAEIMVEGLAMFVASTRVPLQIRLVRKGLHVKETQALVEKLGLARHVTWLDEMTQKQVEQEYAEADVVIDQLGEGLIGMVSLDAMAMGRPVIANGRPEIIEPLVGEPSPICQASTPAEVSEQLSHLHFNPAQREQIGLASRTYVEKHFSSTALALRCLRVFAADTNTSSTVPTEH